MFGHHVFSGFERASGGKLNGVLLGFVLILAPRLSAQESRKAEPLVVNLQVEAGTPLRLYITDRVWYRLSEPVTAKVLDPVWAFDREVIPVGSVLHGSVTKLNPVAKMVRAHALLGGDFTPLKKAEVSFTELTLPDGRSLPIQTFGAVGMNTLYTPPRPSKTAKKQADTNQKTGDAQQSSRRGVERFVRQQARTQLNSQLNARTRGLYDFVRGPNKREWIANFLVGKLPYHPQWYRARTRFDTVLEKPLDFGTAGIRAENLTALGKAPPADSTVQMRIVSGVSSADSQLGEPVDGILSQPVFTADRRLVLPQGTHVMGKITLAQRARLFHRGGKLRFAIDGVQLPATAEAYSLQPARETVPAEAQITSVEGDPKAVKVDAEGTAKATESKTRLLRPAIAGLIAAKTLDEDAGKQSASASANGNTSGRALGGFSGFGLLGMAAARGPAYIGSVLGFYGLAWSVYSNVVARGAEVTFEKNTEMAIRFGANPRTATTAQDTR
ncbi:MAG: TrbI/VirB10 family protein [Acidobacteriaceae bacterium]|nr:TrbI/VirB10 family protein [Acidobacteriaceae bacterium]